MNVILVDWRDGADDPNYIKAAENVAVCGGKVNQFLRDVKLDTKTIYCVGHSLGAQ